MILSSLRRGVTWNILGILVCTISCSADPPAYDPIRQSCWDLVEHTTDGCNTKDDVQTNLGRPTYYCQDIPIESFAKCSDLCGEWGTTCIAGNAPPNVVGHHQLLPRTGDPWAAEFLEQSGTTLTLDLAPNKLVLDDGTVVNVSKGRIFGHDDQFTIYSGMSWQLPTIAGGYSFTVIRGNRSDCKENPWRGVSIDVAEVDYDKHALRGGITRFEVLCDVQSP